ncbi:trypsin-like peptidase domain-containing protein, partial [Plantactinospora solaniradicis]
MSHPHDVWTATVYGPGPEPAVIGSGVLVDEWRVLTCDHVVARHRAAPAGLEVAFRKAGVVPTLRVRVARVSEATPEADVAVLDLVEPVRVPPAPLLCPEPANLLGDRWWAFGFPKGFPRGNAADGRVGEVLADGCVRLNTESRYGVEQGFSGTGLWSQRYRAVVGLVGQVQVGGPHRGDADAVTLHRADLALPEAKLAVLAGWRVDDADEVAHAAWGWTLTDDHDAAAHWDPRGRGVIQGDERGFRFQGRRAALSEIVMWLAVPPGAGRPLLVTGSPGSGKSAVLGRLVTTADARYRQQVPDDGQVAAPVGAIACAVHLKGKTVMDAANEIARAAALRLPQRPDEVAPALYRWLAARPRRRFTVVLDALDEAFTPAEARAVITELILPVARTCAEVGAQVLVGTRRYDHGGRLLDVFGDGVDLIDLDEPRYFDRADLVAYALATLQLRGQERSGNPYNDAARARPVADRIAELAQGNFLVAGLVARRHGLHDLRPVDPDRLHFPPDVGAALRDYLARLTDAGLAWVDAAMTTLAYAQAPGMPLHLWQTALGGTGVQVAPADLAAFATGSAANFLIDASTTGDEPTYRLFHQALNDTLQDTPDRRARQRAITTALITHGQHHGWVDVHPYLLRALPIHASGAGIVDQLLTDDAYVLQADVPRLLSVADHAVTALGRDRARLLRLTPSAADAAPGQRAELFSITAALEHLAPVSPGRHSIRYRARWAATKPRAEYAILEGHTGRLYGVCGVSVSGRSLLASASGDGTVRLWDPVTGQHEQTLKARAGSVNGVCGVSVGGRSLLASACADGTVRLWDVATGQHERTLEGHRGSVNGVCGVSVGGRSLLASACADGTVRLWDVATGQHERSLEGHT